MGTLEASWEKAGRELQVQVTEGREPTSLRLVASPREVAGEGLEVGQGTGDRSQHPEPLKDFTGHDLVCHSERSGGPWVRVRGPVGLD